MKSPALSPDRKTAEAFATSWNNLPEGSVYTREQFEDWMQPLTERDFVGRTVLEMGCGNGSLMVHAAAWRPASLLGIDLGESIQSARQNLERSGATNWRVEQADLVAFRDAQGFDVVYCIGVLHHLETPLDGLRAVIANVAEGGRFHCWVYAREGNLVVRLFVEPLRIVFSRFPWWFTKYLVATPLTLPVFLYAKTLSALRFLPFIAKLPLAEYSFWIARRKIGFFRHVIFDQLVTPRTHYISRPQIESWLAGIPEIDPRSIYLIRRNGNSWKFGGRVQSHTPPKND